MNDMQILKCPHCGMEQYRHFQPKNGGYVCKACLRYFSHRTDEERIRAQVGYDHIKQYDFTQAYNTFQELLNDCPDSLDALWGALLSYFGVRHIKGFFDKEIKPVFFFPHYNQLKGVTVRSRPEYQRFEQRLQQEPQEIRELYQKKISEIERALNTFKERRLSIERDVFICTKISNACEDAPDLKGTTPDYGEALAWYDLLTKKYKKEVFLSKRTLHNDPYSDDVIWTSLLKSKKMLLIVSREEYANSAWVQSEWRRWCALGREKELYIYVMADEQDAMSKLPPALQGAQIYYDTPERRAELLADLTSSPVKTSHKTTLPPTQKKETVTQAAHEEKKPATQKPKTKAATSDEKWIALGYYAAILAILFFMVCLTFRLYWPEGLRMYITAPIIFIILIFMLTIAIPEIKQRKRRLILICLNIPFGILGILSWLSFSLDKEGIIITIIYTVLWIAELCLIIITFVTKNNGRKITWMDRLCIVLFLIVPFFCLFYPCGIMAINNENQDGFLYHNIEDTEYAGIITTNHKTKTLIIPDKLGEWDVALLCESDPVHASLAMTEMEAVYIPSTVRIIADGTFHESPLQHALHFGRCKTLSAVYYGGTEAYWNLVSIEENNNRLSEATVYFYSDSAPTEAGNFWHYGEDGLPVAWEPVSTDFSYRMNFDGASYSVVDFHDKNATSVRIPDTYNGLPVVRIDDELFADCKNLKYVIFSSNLRTIGTAAFQGCENLTNISLPDSVTEIGANAFGGCTSLTSIRLPESLTKIGSGAFRDCSRLSTVTIPHTVTTIGAHAFAKCSALTYVRLPASLSSIEANLFEKCTSLTEIHIPDKVAYIESEAFFGCLSLSRIVLPKTVTVINYNAFLACEALSNVFYTGTPADRDETDIRYSQDWEGNFSLLSQADWFYYSETPLDDHPYWRYIGETIVYEKAIGSRK